MSNGTGPGALSYIDAPRPLRVDLISADNAGILQPMRREASPP